MRPAVVADASVQARQSLVRGRMRGVDLAWAESMLQEFVDDLDAHRQQHHPKSNRAVPSADDLTERLEVMEKIVRAVIPDARFQLGRRGYTYTFDQVAELCRRALGLVRMSEELE